MEEFIPIIILLIVIVGLFMSTFKRDQLRMDALVALGRYKALEDSRSIEGVPLRECSNEEFFEAYGGLYRFYDHKESLGITKAEAFRRGLKPKFILIRDDGWAVACSLEGFEETFKLYPDLWVEILY